jgi:hypothetical protein
MPGPLEITPSMPEVEQLILIATGAHLRAELFDRPIAYRLREAMEGWLDRARQSEELSEDASGRQVIVCTDVWWINNDELRRRPTISIGGPGTNALTAYLGDKAPSAFVVDDEMMIQLDVDFVDLWGCIWGQSPPHTAAAVDVFIERYLDGFMRAAIEA